MNLDETLALLAENPLAVVDVAEAALHLARDEFPDLDVEALLNEFTAMAHEARRFLGGTHAAQVQGLCRYLFHELGFHGNQKDYYDARNSYLNLVLERRSGIPISLSALTMAVGNRAGLRIEGVGLPGHFVVKSLNGTREILFDPFHGGRVLSPEDCEILVAQVTGQPFQASPGSLEATPPGAILQRMPSNLKIIYWRQEDFSRTLRVLRRLRQLRPSDTELCRDEGACLVQMQEMGKAVDRLETYLAAAPKAKDAEAVRELLRQARAAIAGWN